MEKRVTDEEERHTSLLISLRELMRAERECMDKHRENQTDECFPQTSELNDLVQMMENG